MALTSLQATRISFHLDVYDEFSLLAIDRDIKFNTLTDEELLAIVGPPSPPNPYLFEGQFLCSETSILGRLEAALANISPAVVNHSLLVESAGKVTLRRDEVKARERLYKSILKELFQAMGYSKHTDTRVGFTL